jgi:hypothetical protein
LTSTAAPAPERSQTLFLISDAVSSLNPGEFTTAVQGKALFMIHEYTRFENKVRGRSGVRGKNRIQFQKASSKEEAKERQRSVSGSITILQGF